MTPNKLKVAVTGGIGSGKSTVCRILSEMGYPVFSCDECYKALWNDSDYITSLSRLFPEAVTSQDPDKKKLSEIVFHDPIKLKQLNQLSHPLIMQRILHEMEGHTLSFAEVPLLFEGGFEGLFDRIIVVYRSEADRIAAVSKRDRLTEKEVISRIKNQVDYEKIIKNGHTVIYNDEDEKSLQEKVSQVLENWLR